MAAADSATRLANIAANLESELEDETARRAALTAAGKPPPTTYTYGGQTLDWNGYMTAMIDAITKINDLAAATGSDDDLYELPTSGYSP